MGGKHALAAISMALLLPASAGAQALASSYSVRLFGAPVGRLSIAANSNAHAYAARGEFRTTGLVGLLARVRFTMTARGAGAFPDYRTVHYGEEMDTGYRTSTADINFPSGDRRIDPLTGILAALLDRPQSKGCAFQGTTFDGARTMRVQIHEVRHEDDELICGGALVRTSGYSAKEMAQAQSFPFTITYERDGEWLKPSEGHVDTIHGKVALVRK